jgi:hypothetical protein
MRFLSTFVSLRTLSTYYTSCTLMLLIASIITNKNLKCTKKILNKLIKNKCALKITKI